MPIQRQPPDGSTCCVCVQSKLFKPRLCIHDNDIIIVGTIGHRLILPCNESIEIRAHRTYKCIIYVFVEISRPVVLLIDCIGGNRTSRINCVVWNRVTLLLYSSANNESYPFSRWC